jgi:hypothetical protein
MVNSHTKLVVAGPTRMHRLAGQQKKVTGIMDYRTILDDRSVDAVVTAMPDQRFYPVRPFPKPDWVCK